MTERKWSPQQLAMYRRKIADTHLKTVRKTFDLLRQSELDVNLTYAAFEWLFDCRNDLLHALENIENDAGQIPEHAWKVIQDAVEGAGGQRKDIPVNPELIEPPQGLGPAPYDEFDYCPVTGGVCTHDPMDWCQDNGCAKQ